MKGMKMRPAYASAVLLLLLGGLAAPAAEYTPPGLAPPDAAEEESLRYIVKLRDAGPMIQAAGSDGTTANATADASATARVHALAARVRAPVLATRALGANLHMLELAPGDAGATAQSLLAALRADSSVEFAVPDRRVHAHSILSQDPLVDGQWYLGDAEAGAVDAMGAWDTTRGSAGVVVAVLDSGVLFDHPDLGRASRGGRLLPGYDFISADRAADFFTANDGDGRDPDPSDPGDHCDATASSWHGTRVAGIIGAQADNGVGVAGVTWSGYLLPVRVIGRCSGFNSDILAALRWAAGLEVPGVPRNPYPARVANLSLGSDGPCDQASRSVIEEVVAAGMMVVVAAGNSGGRVGSPANCPGAVGIAALRHAGTKAGYSNFGPGIALGAPGGNCVNINAGQPCLYSINTTSNDGIKAPGTHTWTSQADVNVGTSFAAPIVSGIAGLMLAVNGNLSPGQLLHRLQAGAATFATTSDGGTPPACKLPTGPLDFQPSECACTTDTCGAGMANARGAVREALRPIAAVSVPAQVSAGDAVVLSARGSAAACNRWITSHAWSVVTGNAVLQGADTDMVSLQAPAGDSIVVSLTVTDNAGASDIAQVTLTPGSVASTAPSTAGSQACLAQVEPPAVVGIAADADEVSEDSPSFSFTISRAGNLEAALTLAIEAGGTATAGNDYLALPETVTLPPGVADITLVVQLLDDDMREGEETLLLSLVPDGSIDFDNASALVILVDDESAPDAGAGEKGGGSTDLLLVLALLWLGAARLRRCPSA